MENNVSAATAMLGLDGFVLLAVSEYAGELEQAIETIAVEDFCRGCGVQARLHNRRPTWVRDLPAGGRPVTLVWVKGVWRCMEPACPVSTWSEASTAIRPRASLTERARAEACRRVGQDGHSVAQVASGFGVAWATVMAAVVEYGTPRVNDPERLAGVKVLGVDQTAFLAANAKRHTQFVTGMVDVTGCRLLDVVQGRSGTVLSQWIDAQPQLWREHVRVAALDPFRGYATALRTSLPHAIRVLDAFHVTRLGFAAVDDVRRRVQQQSTGHRGRRDDPLFKIRRLLRRGHENLTDTAWDRLSAGLQAGDVDSQIQLTWIAAQDLRLLYRASGRDQAEQRLYRWMVHCADSDIPELHRLARTIEAWRPELLAYFDTNGVSNGPTEAMNLIIKKIKRTGHGFRNFDNYRLRLLLHCGVDWHTQQPTRIRGRLPRLAASLLTGHERLRPETFATMWNSLIDTGDAGIQILQAYTVKEELRAVLALAGTNPPRPLIRARLDSFYQQAAATDAPEAHRLAATIEAWWPAIEAGILTGYSNARSEGYNRLAKHQGRNAFGFRNPVNQRRRIRWACTRQYRRASAVKSTLPG